MNKNEREKQNNGDANKLGRFGEKGEIGHDQQAPEQRYGKGAFIREILFG